MQLNRHTGGPSPSSEVNNELTDTRRDRIEQLAFQIWQQRGEPWGTPDEDWFEAERQLAEAPSGLAEVAREVGGAVGNVVAFFAGVQAGLNR